jgi:hypothetical protein
MESAGLAMSVTSSFGVCKAGYKFIRSMKNASSSTVRAQCKCEIEEARFLLWGRSWGLVDDTGALLPTAHIESKLAKESVSITRLVAKILAEIATILGGMDSIKEKYALEATVTAGDKQNISDTVRYESSYSMTLKRKITWSTGDKESFLALAVELRDLNSGLYSLLPMKTQSLLSDALSTEILCTKSTQTDIEMIKEISEEDEPKLSSAAGLKLLGLDVSADDAMWSSLPTTKMPKAAFRVQTSEFGVSETRTSSAMIRPVSYATHVPGEGRDPATVMIEWKPYDQRAGVSRAYVTAMRADSLCRLLRKFSSISLGVLSCMGFFDDIATGCFGFAFKLPQCPLYGTVSQPLTLNHLIGNQPSLPPLEDRFRLSSVLARTLIAFHCSEWLHKDFSSKNILLGTSPGDTSKPDLTRPYVIGFTYSRPDDHEGISSEIRQPAADEPFYQHPSLTPNNGRVAPRYCKAFDLWALGCVLLEVGLWRRLDDLWKPKYSETRDKWVDRLKKNWTRELRGRCGGTYEEVVNICLDAHDVVPSSQSYPFWDILAKLDSLHV